MIDPATSPAASLAIGIATAGRPATLRQALADLARQTRRPDAIIVCAPRAEDTAGAEAPGLTLLHGPCGLPAQRNAILDAAAGVDLLVFLDDDFVMQADYLATTALAFARWPEVAMTTGQVVADGVRGPGLAHAEALALLADAVPAAGRDDGVVPVPNGYGCNMALRMAAVRRRGLRFDEGLPLYAWLEDIDFSVRLRKAGGRVVRVPAARGVHLGVKSGRQSGLRLGYSQIANPIYLMGKGTCPPRKALHLMTRNLAANILRCGFPEPHVDRAGRMRGNLRALADAALFRLDPRRILGLGAP